MHNWKSSDGVFCLGEKFIGHFYARTFLRLHIFGIQVLIGSSVKQVVFVVVC